LAKTKANEREFQGQDVAWIKDQINHGGLPFKNVTNDSSLSGLPTTRFPDVLLTLDFECHQPFCGWELKTPTTDARDAKLLKDAVEKAQTIKAKYFVTWNMQTAIIWQTPEANRTTVTEQYKIYERTNPRITDVNDIRDPAKALLLQEMCFCLLRDLHQLHNDEKVNLHTADTTVFVSIVSTASNKMSDSLLRDLNRQRGNKDFQQKLIVWGTKQGVSRYDEEYWQALSRQIAYKIIGKILFYISLRHSRLELPKFELSRENYKLASKQLKSYFQRALEIDYQAIFEPDITDEIELSHQTIDIIIDLIDSLVHWSFELAPLDVVGNVFEKVIPEDARHSLGQYFTPENLVDLIISFCVKGSNDYVIDPTCGTGTFLIRSYNRLKQFRTKSHHELLDQIWGFDIAGFPAELATINLCRQNFGDYLNFPRVLCRDFFDVMPNSEYEFPPPKKGAKIADRVKVKLPVFDAAVGNFPFIRQELIEKVEKGYKKKLETSLEESWRKDYPELFSNGFQLSGQADIYAYMFFHAAAHIKIGGRIGIVTSNSWLDVAYGHELQKFFLNKFKLIAICESRCEPWFEQSAVNTVFTILERSDDVKANKENLTRFVKFKKPLKELFPEDALSDAQNRWIKLERFVDRIESICADGKAWNKDCKKFENINAEYIKEPQIISYEDEDIRMRIIKQQDLKNAVDNESQTVKWGKYLRAPDIYFEIMAKCADKFAPLSKSAILRYGIKTGINEFFLLTQDIIDHWQIEDEFIKPIITSTREIPNILIDKLNTDKKIFVCNKNKTELRGTNALKYIKYGEHKKTEDGLSWPEVESVKGRKYWYAIAESENPEFIIIQFRDKRLYAPINFQNFPVSNVVFGGKFTSREDKNIGCAFLNSTLMALFCEIYGRINLGDGLLTTYGPEIENLPIPSSDKNNFPQEELNKLFKKLSRRPVLPFNEEIKNRDRAVFEKLIFKSLGLTEQDYKSVCIAVNELIEERHIIPKLRTKQKKKRIQQDYSKLKDEISEEILADGIKRFPDAFIKKNWSNIEYEELSVPAEKLKLGENFFGQQQICLSDGKEYMVVSSEEKGKYIIYAQKKDEHVIKIPKNGTVIKKTIQDYEFYLKELQDKLFKAFMEQSGNLAVSENLTNEIFTDLSLPLLKN